VSRAQSYRSGPCATSGRTLGFRARKTARKGQQEPEPGAQGPILSPPARVNGSIKIGMAFGIPIRIHWTFLLVPYLFLSQGVSLLETLVVITVVFGCVLLHELGHSLVAKGFGIRVVDISFWPLGGMARMSEIPESPRIEGLVAIAGPAVNFALAGIGILALLLTGVLGFPGGGFLFRFAGLNLLQGTFNLIPAFPMDGGRILRAFLGRKRDWVSATEIAVRVGRIVAGILFVASIAVMIRWQSVCILPLIAVFVWFAGARELIAVRMRHGVFPFGNSWRPGAAAAGPAAAEAVDPGAARRPSSWATRAGSEAGEGFSEEEIRRLESYRGPLRRPPE